jgi:hypothetical protein
MDCHIAGIDVGLDSSMIHLALEQFAQQAVQPNDQQKCAQK